MLSPKAHSAIISLADSSRKQQATALVERALQHELTIPELLGILTTAGYLEAAKYISENFMHFANVGSRGFDYSNLIK